jgi:hypothetical protein
MRDEQTLSMVSSPDRSYLVTHTIETGVRSVPRLNRAGVIYRANASGKSNLIFGLMTIRRVRSKAGPRRNRGCALTFLTTERMIATSFARRSWAWIWPARGPCS